MNNNFIYRILTYLLTILLLGVGQITHAQYNPLSIDTSEQVIWIGEHTNNNIVRHGEFKKKLGQIIFGRKKLDLVKPISIVAFDTANMWVLDQTNGAVIQIINNELEIPTFIEKHKNGFGSLVGICNYKEGSFLFTDSSDDKILYLNVKDKEIKYLNESVVLKQPTGIAYSKISNEIWVVETSAHRVVVCDANGNMLRSIGKRGNGNSEFNFPTFIWIDNQGNVYIVDSMNFRVQVFDKDGTLISVFGEAGDATGYFARPKGIATDNLGNIYIVDALFHTVQIFDINGRFLYQFGNQGQGKGEFWMPSGIFIDDKNYIYISDSYNSRIQMFKLNRGVVDGN